MTQSHHRRAVYAGTGGASSSAHPRAFAVSRRRPPDRPAGRLSRRPANRVPAGGVIVLLRPRNRPHVCPRTFALCGGHGDSWRCRSTLGRAAACKPHRRDGHASRMLARASATLISAAATPRFLTVMPQATIGRRSKTAKLASKAAGGSIPAALAFSRTFWSAMSSDISRLWGEHMRAAIAARRASGHGDDLWPMLKRRLRARGKRRHWLIEINLENLRPFAVNIQELAPAACRAVCSWQDELPVKDEKAPGGSRETFGPSDKA